MEIDNIITEIEETIKKSDEAEAERIYNKALSIYSKLIDGFEDGTKVLEAKTNMVLNLNYDHKEFPEETNYLFDLNIILPKLKNYRDTLNLNSTPIYNNNNSINITNSTINDSNVGRAASSSKDKAPLFSKFLLPLLITIIGGVVVGLILYFIQK